MNNRGRSGIGAGASFLMAAAPAAMGAGMQSMGYEWASWTGPYQFAFGAAMALAGVFLGGYALGLDKLLTWLTGKRLPHLARLKRRQSRIAAMLSDDKPRTAGEIALQLEIDGMFTSAAYASMALLLMRGEGRVINDEDGCWRLP